MDSLNKVKDKELSIESQNIDEALSDYGFEEKRPGILYGLNGSFADKVEPFIRDLDSIGCEGRFTSGRRSSGKNKKSLHLTGQALDMTLPSDDCYCKAMDICSKYPQLFCLDERKKITRDWSAPHLHVSISRGTKTKPCGSGISLPLDNEDNDYSDYESDPLIVSIKKLADANKTIKYDDKKFIKYDSDVKRIQDALKFLGFSLSKFGSDGKFGPETENSVMDFQKTYGLDVTGVLEKYDLMYLTAALVADKFGD